MVLGDSIVGVRRCQSTAENLSTVRLSGGSRFVNIVGDCSVKISSSVKWEIGETDGVRFEQPKLTWFQITSQGGGTRGRWCRCAQVRSCPRQHSAHFWELEELDLPNKTTFDPTFEAIWYSRPFFSALLLRIRSQLRASNASSCFTFCFKRAFSFREVSILSISVNLGFS